MKVVWPKDYDDAPKKKKAKKEDSDEVVAVVPEEPKQKSNKLQNPHGCLRGKAGCKGSPIRVLNWKDRKLFVCPCQFDTFNPPRKVRDLAQAEGLL